MAYQGDEAYFCGDYNFANAHAVTVSGASWNPCGHLLLNTGGVGGWYFHIAEVRGKPKFMRQAGGSNAGLYANCPTLEVFK